MKFDDEICKGVSCHECSFNKGEDGCLLAERLDEIDITPESCEEHTETNSCDCERTETHDLVSRRAALEAMDTWDKFGCDPDGKLVRYDDDKHYVPYVHYEDMVHAVKNLPPAQPRWIPVTLETLPNLNSVVVVCGKKGTWDYGTYRGWSGDIHSWQWKKNTIKHVYWWMYKADALPEQYEGEQDENN